MLASIFVTSYAAPPLLSEKRLVIPFAPFVLIGTVYTLFIENKFGQFLVF
jgi:hypothetical protein